MANGLEIQRCDYVCLDDGRAKITLRYANNSVSTNPEVYRYAGYVLRDLGASPPVQLSSGGSGEIIQQYEIYITDLSLAFHIRITNQNGDEVFAYFGVACQKRCDITTGSLKIASKKDVSEAGKSDGSVTLGSPSTMKLQWRLDKIFRSWQESPTFANLPAGDYNGYVSRVDMSGCADVVQFTIGVAYFVNTNLSLSASAIIPATNQTLNNGGATLNSGGMLANRTYTLVVTSRGNTSSPPRQFVYNSGTTSYTEVLQNLWPDAYDAILTEDDGAGHKRTVSTSFVVAKYLKGCTDTRARNYNPEANVPDESCIFATGNNGLKAYHDLEQYYLDDNSNTGLYKPNVPTDSDYVPPTEDTNACPL